MSKILLIVYFASTFYVTETARILGVFPTPSISHQVVFRSLTKELLNRGHEVVVITTDPEFSKETVPVNLTEIDVHDISYKFLSDVMADMVGEFGLGKEYDWVKYLNMLHEAFRLVEVQIKSEPLQKLIRENAKFDILLIEAYMKPAIVFSNIFKAPVILVSSFGATLDNLDQVGASTHPLLYPMMFRQRLYNLSLLEKLQEYYAYAKYVMYYKNINERKDDELLQRIFGPNTPTINELNKNVDMLFLNVHPMWMDNQPVPPSVVFMGGIHQKAMKELPQDLKSYLDSSKSGVIYVSFGTNVHSAMIPSERLKMMAEAFSELPYDILFKWSDDELPVQNSNIKLVKWLPQSDLLRHPKIKAFVMQGGLQSTDEAITAGVPLVCIPLLADQWFNAEKYVRLKIGLQLDFLTLTKSKLKDAIETVVQNDSYRQNILKLRDIINDQPQPPLHRAIWWIEYVIRHRGAKHLRAPAANISWMEYYELELLIPLLLILQIVLICVFISIVITVRFLWRHVNPLFFNDTYKLKQS